MPFDTIEQRVGRAIRDTVAELAQNWVADGSVVVRRTPEATGLGTPAIVISDARERRIRSPAGMRARDINRIVSFYFDRMDEKQKGADQQSYLVESVKAAFDLPVTMPSFITGEVPEAEELRVLSADNFLPPQYRYQVDVHRILIAVTVCQESGVFA